MTSRTRTRFAGRLVALLALTGPLTGTLLAVSVTPAFAGGSISAPASTVTSGSALSASASITAGTGPTRFALSLDPTGPAGAGEAGGYADDVSMDCSQRDDPSTPLKDEACQGQSRSFTPSLAGRANGRWTASLDGAVNQSKVFYTNFAPTADPSGLTAQGTGASRVDLSWSYNGTEPDLAGFRISDGQGNTFRPDRSACSGSACGYTAYYDNPTPGNYNYSYTVTALRTSGGCDGCGAYTESRASSSAGAQLVTPPPPPSPTPTPSESVGGGTTGGTTGTTGGTTTGTSTGSSGSTTGTGPGTAGPRPGGTSGTTAGSASRPIAIPTLPPIAASRRAFALGFNRFSPSLGIPKLPPLPATTFPTTAPGTEVYQPTLPYGAQPGKTTTKVMSSPIASITNSIDAKQLAKPLAVALILLVAAAHVRIFLSHETDD